MTVSYHNIGDIPLMSWDTCRAKFRRIKQLEQEIAENDNPKLRDINYKTIKGIRKQIVLGNTRLVVTLAKKAEPDNFREVVGAGVAALIRSVNTFNPDFQSARTNEIRFSTYACNAIINAINAWKTQQHLVLNPNAVVNRNFYLRACDSLATKGNYSPSITEIRDELVKQATPSKVKHWSIANVELAARTDTQFSVKRVDLPLYRDDDNETRHPSYTVDHNGEMDNNDRLDLVAKQLDKLPERMQFAFKHRYGMHFRKNGAHTKFKPLTLDEVGIHIGVSKERVRQIIESAARKIKDGIAAQT